MELNLDWRARRSTVWPEVCYEIRPLRVWAFQELLAFREQAPQTPGATEPAFGAGAAEEAAASGGTTFGGTALGVTARMMAVARRIFPDHVRNVTGLQVRTEAGASVPSAAELCDEALALPLAAEMMAALVELSALDEDAEKN